MVRYLSITDIDDGVKVGGRGKGIDMYCAACPIKADAENSNDPIPMCVSIEWGGDRGIDGGKCLYYKGIRVDSMQITCGCPEFR
jgi:hypothetical protein